MLFAYFDCPVNSQLTQVEIVQVSCPKANVAWMIPSEFASIIKIPPTAPKAQKPAYGDLPRSEEDVKKITQLIATMGAEGKISLLLKAADLKRLGAEIDHVHPLRFLGVVFASAHLKSCMKEIYDDFFKWREFFNGFSTRMILEASRDMLHCYLEEFGREVHVDGKNLTKYIQSQDWEGLLVFLMNH